jgi:hypothetical protein
MIRIIMHAWWWLSILLCAVATWNLRQFNARQESHAANRDYHRPVSVTTNLKRHLHVVRNLR